MLLGNVAGGEDDFETGYSLAASSASRFAALGDEYYARLATGNSAYFLQELGRLDDARAMLDETIRNARVAGDERNLASSLGQLGMVTIEQGRPEDALEPLSESLRIWDSLGDLPMAARDLRRLARVLAETQRPEAAVRVLAASESMREEAGHWEGWIGRSNQLVLDRARPALADDAFERAWAEGRGISVDDALSLARSATTGSR
jgi:tetratricopeptide (TPR) repeat protein